MHATTGMRGSRRQIKTADPGLGAGQAGRGAEDELLVKLRRAKVQCPTHEALVRFWKCPRGEDMSSKDEIAEPRGQMFDSGLHPSDKAFGFGFVPCPS
jgi:hypothetical protein